MKHFTDREDVQAVFLQLLNRPVRAVLPVLVFYGVGGREKPCPRGNAAWDHLGEPTFDVDQSEEFPTIWLKIHGKRSIEESKAG